MWFRSLAELEQAPDDTVIRIRRGDVYEKQSGRWYGVGAAPGYDSTDIPLPVAVIDYPRELAKPDAVIIDVDGTIVDVSSIRHYVLQPHGKKNFDLFHAAAVFCPPIMSTITTLELLDPSIARIVVTARSRQWEYKTRAYLNEWIRFDELHMRTAGDQRKDVEVKRDILATIRQTYNVRLAIDDNPSVIQLWESEDIPTITVPGWVTEEEKNLARS